MNRKNIFSYLRMLLAVSFVIAATSADAYIPKFWLIVSKTADTHGTGAYRMIQEVQFLHLDEPIVVLEEWLVDSESRMFVRVTGKGAFKDRIRMNVYYDGANKTFVSANGSRQQDHLTTNWFEDFFWFRNSDRFKTRLYNLKMIPREGLARPASPRSVSQVRHTPESYVRLGRSNGRVAYTLGSISNEGTEPGIWIEQDAFRILRVRVPGPITVRADDYKQFGETLQFPRTREVQWGDKRVVMKVLDIKPTSSGSVSAALVSPGPQSSLMLPEEPVVKDFYSRFR